MRSTFALLGGLALCAAAQAQSRVLVGVENSGVNVQVWDVANNQYLPALPTGGNLVTSMAADNAARVTYFSTRFQLWNIPHDSPRTPTMVAAYAGATSQIFGGLAWDSARGTLYGTTANSLYTIDTTTGATSLVRTIAGADFGGLDYDADTDRLYATNDSVSTTAPLVGRGVYTIAPPYATGAVARIMTYPVGEIDIDGLAVGGGLAYLCEDETNSMHVLDLSSLTYIATIAQPGIGVDRGACGAAFFSDVAPDFDLRAAIVAPAPCTAAAGERAVFTVQISNPGGEPLSDVVASFTFPAGVTFIASNPPGTVVANVLTVGLGGVDAGTQSPIDVELLVNQAGPLAVSATAAAAEPDPIPSNNDAEATTTVLPQAPASAQITGVMSTIPSSASSAVPGIPGVRFAIPAAGTAFASASRSPDGTKWIIRAASDAPSDSDELLLVHDGAALSVAGRENLFPLIVSTGGAFPPLHFDEAVSINDAGGYAFSGIDARAGTTDDGFVARVVGGTASVVVQENVTVAGVIGAGVTFGSLRGSVHIASDDSVSFFHSLAGGGVSVSNDTALFGDDGATLLAREGVSVPTGQVDSMGAPTSFTFKSFDTSRGMTRDGAGDHFLAPAAINASTTLPSPGGVDRVLVRDGAVVVQENVVLAGSVFTNATAHTAPFGSARMEHDGSWLAIGANFGNEFWVVKDGAVIATSGAPIHVGAGESWGATSAISPFIFAAAGPGGRTVVAGVTNELSTARNTVLVLDGAQVIARSSDPIDLDNNQVFDDDAYMGAIHPDGFIGADAVYLLVDVYNAAAAAGCSGSAVIGQAFVRIPLPATPPPCGSADFDGDGDTGTDADIEAFFACLGGSCCATCEDADFNNDGDTGTDADIEAFFRVLAGGPC